MILSDLKNSATFEALHPAFKMVFDYVRTHDLLNAPAGRIELQGDDVFLNVEDVEMLLPVRQKLELHRKYIDIHFPLSETEMVGWCNINDIEKPNPKRYNEERDILLYNEMASIYFGVTPGQFYIMYPEDAHAPILGDGTLRKVVAKVRILD